MRGLVLGRSAAGSTLVILCLLMAEISTSRGDQHQQEQQEQQQHPHGHHQHHQHHRQHRLHSHPLQHRQLLRLHDMQLNYHGESASTPPEHSSNGAAVNNGVAVDSQFEPEFVRSFIQRPWMLSNRSLQEPPMPEEAASEGRATLSLYVDNWSPYEMLLMEGSSQVSGDLDDRVPPRDMASKGRLLALRAASSSSSAQGEPVAKQDFTAGVACWALALGKVKVSRVCVAWDVGNGRPAEVAVSIGDHAPTFEQMWMSSRQLVRIVFGGAGNNEGQHQLSVQKTNQLENTVYVNQPDVAVVAANISMREGETLRYRVTLSVVPPNIDVWAWVKYFRDAKAAPALRVPDRVLPPQAFDLSTTTVEVKSTTLIDSTTTASTTGALTTKRTSTTAATWSTSSMTIPTETSTTTTTTTTTTSGVEAANEVDSSWPQQEQVPIIHKKRLLSKGLALALLEARNKTLRDVLTADLGAGDVAVGFHLENWSKHRLNLHQLEVRNGAVPPDLPPPPQEVDPGSQSVGLVTQGSKLGAGTSGVVRWTLGSADRVLSVMWSVPYNLQFWRRWYAVGLSSHGPDLPTYEEMYGGPGKDVFVRAEAAQQTEFSDGHFIVVARMDGGATSYKPILHLALVPLDEAELAHRVQRQLGLLDPSKKGRRPDGSIGGSSSNVSNDVAVDDGSKGKSRSVRKGGTPSDSEVVYGLMQGAGVSAVASSSRSSGRDPTMVLLYYVFYHMFRIIL